MCGGGEGGEAGNTMLASRPALLRCIVPVFGRCRPGYGVGSTATPGIRRRFDADDALAFTHVR